ncbi:threonine dehydratase [Pontibacillus chungwhensis BH030062]|uniref:Threonine dehydratase n=1 Tax=Pontibacillus chungwhensis BH030062 TaxID=1385513 RepID=A0A0A2UY84_9BACI|nr:hypothetical protein [Pontibacillus chungwhensis]KGP93247.1 threonine dehydratase [Pontibacillus chungwhensis BH030062]
MEFELQTKEGAYPNQITIDSDNGRYMIRSSDTSGQVFNSPQELISWMEQNWDKDVFVHPEEYDHMMKAIRSETDA